MQNKTFNALLAFALFFLAHWFFGNLYEEIVLAPNQLSNSYEAIKNWQHYFTVTNQLYYYIPFTQLAVLTVCFLYFKAKDQVEKRLLKRAALLGIVSLVLTALIVTQLNLKLFFGDVERYRHELFSLSVIWLIGNAIRLCFVGGALFFTFRAYLVRKTRDARALEYAS